VLILRDSVEKFMPTLHANMSVTGKFRVVARIPAFYYVRLLWNQNYPNLPMTKDSYFYRSTIRDYYFQLGKSEDWLMDPLSWITEN